MKIQCDVCGKDEAAVFCTADEAALCGSCDHRVHHANKLASKHQRFSLLSPSSNDFPLCDVCQEKRAFLFCQQDRAILCRECDVPIHTANEHTQKHNRFLLTGVKLSATSAIYTSAAAASASVTFDTVPDFRAAEASSVKKPRVTASTSSQPPPPPKSTTTAVSAVSSVENLSNKEGNSNSSSMAAVANPVNGSTSSISEYLIEMLPGWHFEELLDSCSASFGFCKSGGGSNHDGMLPIMDGDDLMSNSSLSSESMGIWVPQAPNPISPAAISYQSSEHLINGINKEAAAFTRQQFTIKHNNNNNLNNNKRWSDDVFAVPQISPPSSVPKRSRHFY